MPAIAADAAHLTVFQRSPTWVGPRYDEPFTAEQHELFERDLARRRNCATPRSWLTSRATSTIDSTMTKELTKFVSNFVMESVKDPELRAKLTPSHPVGCKRPLFSGTWFPTFELPNVVLETTPDRGASPSAACAPRTASSTRPIPSSTGRGFVPRTISAASRCTATGGRDLHDDWREGAEAYLGTVVPGYPNLFTLYGPNTNGVQSIIWIIEAQVEFVRRLLDSMGRQRVQAVDVKREIHDAYNDEIQAALARTVWQANCNNYFRHPNGKIVTQFPYHGQTLADRLSQVELDQFNCQPADDGRRKDGESCAESTIAR